jgi:hypothetical protein
VTREKGHTRRRATDTAPRHKTTLWIDRRKLARARKILGTKGIKDTIDEALDQVLVMEARRRFVDKLRSLDGIDLDDERVMAEAWR